MNFHDMFSFVYLMHMALGMWANNTYKQTLVKNRCVNSMDFSYNVTNEESSTVLGNNFMGIQEKCEKRFC